MKYATLIFGILINIVSSHGYGSQKIVSHCGDNVELFDLAEYKATYRITKGDSNQTEHAVSLIDQLGAFDLGRYLLIHKGLNGYWTSYIITHGHQKLNLGALETWILHHAPSVRATRERFGIFQDVLQHYLRDNNHVASIPCGVMDDLLTLNYDSYKNVQLTGIDLDKESLALATNNAICHKIGQTYLIHRDAWHLNITAEYDIITSNGLNIYEVNDTKVTNLYRQFSDALKPGGILVTSFLTPPPMLSSESPWRNVDQSHASFQKFLFSDVLGVK